MGNKYQELQIAKNSESKESVSREEFTGTGEIKCYGNELFTTLFHKFPISVPNFRKYVHSSLSFFIEKIRVKKCTEFQISELGFRENMEGEALF